MGGLLSIQGRFRATALLHDGYPSNAEHEKHTATNKDDFTENEAKANYMKKVKGTMEPVKYKAVDE